ncbi:MAG: tetratricopeptide repeat protein [Puniceicoccaceae bacterium]|nr:MAG: tetratricopeptide repeat protein [Puniceicoccaceae bacterium]
MPAIGGVLRRRRWLGLPPAAAVAVVLFGGCMTVADTGRDVRSEPAAALERALPEVRLEDGTVLELGLADWMEFLAVPGMSLAVVDDYEVIWTSGFGVAEAGSDRPVTPDSLFQAASISKPVAALIALLLVESGDLELDVPVNDLLLNWKLEPASAGGETVPTLRQLLGHTGGLPAGGFAGYDPGAAVPDLWQMLDALPPASNPPARIVGRPGEALVYGGMGYQVVQWLLTERTGEEFARLAERLVFGPLGLANTTFEQPLPKEREAQAASGHNAVGEVLPGRWRVQPELAAAGLWTTPADAAAIAIQTARARRGRPSRVVTPVVAELMLTTHRDHMGLGWMRPPGAPGDLFAHSGANHGYRAHLRMHAATGHGLAVMTNADSGEKLLLPVIAAVAKAFGWPYRPEHPVAPATWLYLVDARLGPERALEEYLVQRERQPEVVSAEDLHDWGSRLLQLGRLDDALLAFGNNAALYPESAHAHLHLARAEVAAGRREEALNSLERALELSPEQEWARRLRARLIERESERADGAND